MHRVLDMKEKGGEIETAAQGILENKLIYSLTGELYKQGMDYIAQMNYNSLPELMTLNSLNW